LLAIGFTKAFKWRINGDLKRKLEDFGLKNVKFTPYKNQLS